MIPEKQVINNMEQFYREIKGKWNTIYPNYFNSNKSIAEGMYFLYAGRKVPMSLAIPDPTIQEMSMACGLCRFKNIIEPHKAYSRDFL